ncbi:MAG: hypothetical protein HC897_03045 [Thermoanaerobaculia bacterium]|nr:hypothetical protein [Thermoanaerobaculia bacterium]
MEDPIVAEVRNQRDEYAKQFNYDLAAIFFDLREKEKTSGQRVVSLPPRRIKPAAVPSRSAKGSASR